MVEYDKTKTTRQKALAINLDNKKYGTIVEIGAGQEVARQFFSVGAAAGSIAKTMSAYDMQVSDDIYGKSGRYVSRERLEQMLDHEYNLLLKRLKEVRPAKTAFFSYAATVTAKSYSQKNECHGWVGIQVQLKPDAPASEIILHVRMLDNTNEEQSDALGILGVNLIYGVYHYHADLKILIDSLQDGMGSDKRIEIDLIHFSGPDFEQVENRLMNLHLIRSWCCRAVMFDQDGNSIVPASALRKKDTLVMRGSFKPPTNVHVDMNKSAYTQFLKEKGVEKDKVLNVAEVTMAELASDENHAGGKHDDANFLARVDLLNSLGYTVLISDYYRFFRLRSWMRRYTQNRIGIVLSIIDFDYLFDDKYYEGLEGGVLEAMGKLFSDNTNVYVYPAIKDEKLVTLETAKVANNMKYLLEHLVRNKKMVAIDLIDQNNLHILAGEITAQIAKGHGDWEQNVPAEVVASIVKNKLFNFKG